MPPKPRLHLPYSEWPPADWVLWERAFCLDDPFAEIRLANASEDRCMWAWRRFLGFLANNEPEALNNPPAERLTIGRAERLVAINRNRWSQSPGTRTNWAAVSNAW
jgi:hypothetical protein